MFLFAQIYCGCVLCILNIKEITNLFTLTQIIYQYAA